MKRVPRLPLTPDQQALAGDPGHVRWASIQADRWAFRWPHLRDDLLSAALLGLVTAAGRYDRSRHGTEFLTFAGRRVVGAMIDCVRDDPRVGVRRRPGGVLVSRVRVASLAAAAPDGKGSLADIVPSPDLPVGWELASADAVEAMARVLPARQRAAVLRYYLGAGTARMHQVAAAEGLSESRVSQLLDAALETLRSLARELPG